MSFFAHTRAAPTTRSIHFNLALRTQMVRELSLNALEAELPNFKLHTPTQPVASMQSFVCNTCNQSGHAAILVTSGTPQTSCAGRQQLHRHRLKCVRTAHLLISSSATRCGEGWRCA